MNTFAGKHILVIGASGAIGQEFTSQLIELGALVSGTARDANSSVRLRPDLAARLLVDLESPQSISALSNYVGAQEIPLDGVILAAGLVGFGPISSTPIEGANRLMQVNALGQIQLIQELLPKLTQSAQSGRNPFVLSISGVISEQPMAGLAAYSASKGALQGFSKAAAKELRKTGITWIDARPGHTESGLASRAIFGEAPAFGKGMEVSTVVRRMVEALLNDEKDLPSSSFN